MTSLEVKAFFKKLWEVRFFIAGTILVTGVLDLIGLGGKADLGVGFILGILLLVGFGIAQAVKAARKTKVPPTSV